MNAASSAVAEPALDLTPRMPLSPPTIARPIPVPPLSPPPHLTPAGAPQEAGPVLGPAQQATISPVGVPVPASVPAPVSAPVPAPGPAIGSLGDETPAIELVSIFRRQERGCWLCQKIAAQVEQGKPIGKDEHWHLCTCVATWHRLCQEETAGG